MGFLTQQKVIHKSGRVGGGGGGGGAALKKEEEPLFISYYIPSNCVKVEVAVLGSPSLISLMVSVDVKQQWNIHIFISMIFLFL